MTFQENVVDDNSEGVEILSSKWKKIGCHGGIGMKVHNNIIVEVEKSLREQIIKKPFPFWRQTKMLFGRGRGGGAAPKCAGTPRVNFFNQNGVMQFYQNSPRMQLGNLRC